jgi:hypothetical protein
VVNEKMVDSQMWLHNRTSGLPRPRLCGGEGRGGLMKILDTRQDEGLQRLQSDANISPLAPGFAGERAGVRGHRRDEYPGNSKEKPNTRKPLTPQMISRVLHRNVDVLSPRIPVAGTSCHRLIKLECMRSARISRGFCAAAGCQLCSARMLRQFGSVCWGA